MNLSRVEKILTPVAFAFYLTGLVMFSWPGALDVAAFSPRREFVVEHYELPQFIAAILAFAAWSLNAWLRPVAKRLIFSSGIAIITLAGLAALSWSLTGTGQTAFFAGLAGVLLGAGLSSGVMVWVRVFATRDFYYSSTRIVCSVGTAAVLYFILQELPALWSWHVALAMMVVSCCSMPACINARDFSQSAFNHKPYENRERYRAQFGNLWRPVLFALATSFTWGIVRAYDLSNGLGSQSNLCISLGMLLSAVTLAFLWTLFNNRYGFVRVFKLLIPVFAIAFMLFFVIGRSFAPYLSALSSYGFSLAWLLMLLICARDAQNKDAHPFIVWGAFAFLYAIASDLLGFLLGFNLALWCAAWFSLPLEAMVALFGFSVFFCALYIDDRHKPEKDTAAHAGESEKDVYAELSARCDRVADRYGLSPREREVFALLARGRDVYHISEEQFVSVSTVQFHSKNIYKKLDIHSKQELITLVDSFNEREAASHQASREG